MRQHLKLLAQVRDISPILAIRSMSPFEFGEFASSDREPALTVTTEASDTPATRVLRVDEEPTIRIRRHGDDVEISCDAEPPSDLCALLAVLGISPGCTTARLDAEKFHDRVLTADAAWILLRRLRNCTDETTAITFAESLLNLSLCWIQNQAAMLSNGEAPALERRSNMLASEAKALAAGHPWLKQLRLLGDPRGAAAEMQTAGFDHEFSVAALVFDWTPQAPEPPKRRSTAESRYGVKPTKLKQPVIDALHAAVIQGREVRLVQRLAKRLYEQVNDVLVSLGGQWHTGKQAHVFPADAEGVLRPVIESGHYYRRQDYEFFWTPEALAARVVALGRLRPGMVVGEPSAGRGAIATLAAAVVGKENVLVYELMPENAAVLRELGFALDGPQDFLAVPVEPLVDVCLMNSPFSGGRDVVHIEHALRWIKPGGRLVAIASTTWRDQQSAGARRFRDQLARLGAVIEDIPRGAFKEAGTDVPTTLIVVDVPGSAPEKNHGTAQQRPPSMPEPTPAVKQLSFF